MNGADLRRFAFERDLTWMAFFLAPDGSVLLRYGGREDDDAESHLSKASLLRAMNEALRRNAANERPEPDLPDASARFARPEDIPTMAAELGRESTRCIHCHDVKGAELRLAKKEGRFDKTLLFTYPSPLRIGIRLDRDEQDLVRSVVAESPADRAGVKSGDRIRSAAGRPVATFAEFERILERQADKAELPVKLDRAGMPLEVTIRLEGAWRRSSDPSWRPNVHLMGPNFGFWGVMLNEAEKKKHGIPPDGLGIRVNFFFDKHPGPKAADLRNGDILVELDGLRTAMTPRQVHAHAQMSRRYGDRVPLKVLRDGKEVKLVMPLPDRPTEGE